MKQQQLNTEDDYFNLGLAVLDLSRKEWEASEKKHSRKDVIEIGKDYEKGMGW